MRGLSLLLLALLPPVEPITETVSAVEINRVLDGEGREQFVQAIFWDWCGCENRLACRDWRMIRDVPVFVRRDADGGWLVWRDGEVLRKVRFSQIRETVTQYDPEVNDRSLLPAECRRKLLQR